MTAISATASLARRLLRITVGVLTVAVVLFGVAVVIPKLLGYQSYVITTGSMRGTADPGSLVLARTVPTSALQVGDVITYVPPPDAGVTHPVTHRIVDVTLNDEGQRILQTKGDANPTPDPWVFTLSSEVQPRMVLSLPLAGYPVLLLADRTVRMIAVGGPALIVALLAFVDLLRGLRATRRADGPVIAPAAAAAVPVLITLPDDRAAQLQVAGDAPAS
jgi:signal peptidase I